MSYTYSIVVTINNQETKDNIHEHRDFLRSHNHVSDVESLLCIPLVSLSGLTDDQLATVKIIFKQVELPECHMIAFDGVRQFSSGSGAIQARLDSASIMLLQPLYLSLCAALDNHGLSDNYRKFSEFLPGCPLAIGCPPIEDATVLDSMTVAPFRFSSIALSSMITYDQTVTYTNVLERYPGVLGSVQALFSPKTDLAQPDAPSKCLVM